MILAIILAAQIKNSVPPQPGQTPTQQRAMERMRIEAGPIDADSHFFRRADGRNGDVASTHEIDAALDGYAASLARRKDDVESRWKYLRATYFKADYTGKTDAERAALYERAIPIAEDAVALERARAGAKLARPARSLEPQEAGAALAGDATAGEVFFWSAVVRGQWALVHGKLRAAREGAAAKIRDDARSAAAVNPELEDGGPYRVLGRLHSVSPKIPFFTGWVDHDKGIDYLRQSVAIAPGNLINLLFLAEALHEKGDSGSEVKSLLDRIAAATPHPDHIVEDLRTQANATRDRTAWGIH
jgi:hypothetical protein